MRAVAGDLPGSTGHYSGQFTLYDMMGRAIQQTNPTEMTHAWVATGDDSGGWISGSQTYDWKGRPLITTNQDGTTKEASYSGCGCAGGAVVTLTDEGTLVNGAPKKRQQKIYNDSTGRTVKTEVLNWDGAGPFATGGSVYATTVNTYNARDQVTLVRQFQGSGPTSLSDLSCPSGTCEATTTTYDGYGRLKTGHVPEQDANTTTTYNYNSDDTTSSVVDARGASQTLTYNNRHLVTGIAYAAPTGIQATPGVSFEYDAAGNRTSMSDGLGTQTYSYDQLSRLTTEARVFTGFNTYTITYGYNLGDQLTSVTDPFGAQVGYTHDALGRVSEITGSGFANVTTYASNFQYRASGQLKHLVYGNGRTLDTTYDSRMKVASFAVPGVVSMTYQHTADGRTSYLHDALDQRFDRSYVFDHTGNLTQALCGAEARGEPATNNRPYNESFSFDVFGNMTGRSGKHWSRNSPFFAATFTNDRMDGVTYDADGRAVLSNTGVNSVYDAAGRLIQATTPQRRNNPAATLMRGYDGNGNQLKNTEYGETTYYVRSSVIGGAAVAEVYGTTGRANFGQKAKGHVFANGKQIAEQNTYLNVPMYKHYEPGGAEEGISGTYPDGTVIYSTTQLDPLDDDVGDADPYLVQEGGGDDPGFRYPEFSDIADLGHGCTVDGAPVMCTFAYEYKMSGGSGNVAAGTIGGAIAMGLLSGIGPLGSRAASIVGGTSLLGRFCVDASSSLGGDGSGAECSTEITGFTNDTTLAATISLRQLTPQNPAPTVPLGNLIQTMHNLLENPRCSNFISSVINTARQLTGNKPLSYSAKELIGMIASNPDGGYFFIPGYSGGRGGGEAAMGLVRRAQLSEANLTSPELRVLLS